MRGLFTFAIVGLYLIGMASSVIADPEDERRIALVIGNSAYQHVPQLRNPIHDANDIADKLKELNFDVIKMIDADANQHRNAINVFKMEFRKADIGLFFYAGQAIAIDGKNYIIPVDSGLASQDAVDKELVRVDGVVQEVGATDGKMFVFLDACRENPFTDKAKAIGASGVGRGLIISRKLEKATQRGLSRLESGNRNLLVAFATQPGNTAEDGTGRNSPFTKGLLAHIGEKLEVREVLTKVRASVGKETSFKQVPWEQNPLLTPIYLAGRPDLRRYKRIEVGVVVSVSQEWGFLVAQSKGGRQVQVGGSVQIAQEHDRPIQTKVLKTFRDRFSLEAPDYANLAQLIGSVVFIEEVDALE